MIVLKTKIKIWQRNNLKFNPIYPKLTQNDRKVPRPEPSLTNSFQLGKIFFKLRFYIVFFTDAIVRSKILKIFQKVKKFVFHKYLFFAKNPNYREK